MVGQQGLRSKRRWVRSVASQRWECGEKEARGVWSQRRRIDCPQEGIDAQWPLRSFGTEMWNVRRYWILCATWSLVIEFLTKKGRSRVDFRRTSMPWNRRDLHSMRIQLVEAFGVVLQQDESAVAAPSSRVRELSKWAIRVMYVALRCAHVGRNWRSRVGVNLRVEVFVLYIAYTGIQWSWMKVRDNEHRQPNVWQGLGMRMRRSCKNYYLQ